MINGKETSQQLWNRFSSSLKSNLQKTERYKFDEAWKSRTHRTKFYKKEIFPLIAHDLNLEYEYKELFRVDHTFFKKAQNGYTVPIIFIESENDHTSIEWEIRKLCSLNTPLKVLFLCFDWTEESLKELEDNDFDWNYILQAYSEECFLTGYFGVIVASWTKDYFRFYALVYDENGKFVGDKSDIVLFEM